jgi:hypothetical protein
VAVAVSTEEEEGEVEVMVAAEGVVVEEVVEDVKRLT